MANTKFIPVVAMSESSEPSHKARSYIAMLPAHLWGVIDNAQELYEISEGILLWYDADAGWQVINNNFSTSDAARVEDFGEDFDAAQARILELGNEYGVVHNAKELNK